MDVITELSRVALGPPHNFSKKTVSVYAELRKMEEQDIEILARLNVTEGTHFILPNTLPKKSPNA